MTDMTDKEQVQLEITAIHERLERLNPDCGITNSAAYTRWVLAQVIQYAGAAMKTLSCNDWARGKNYGEGAEPAPLEEEIAHEMTEPLPDGETCSGCAGFLKCQIMLGSILPSDTICRWEPSQFLKNPGPLAELRELEDESDDDEPDGKDLP